METRDVFPISEIGLLAADFVLNDRILEAGDVFPISETHIPKDQSNEIISTQFAFTAYIFFGEEPYGIRENRFFSIR